MFSLVILLIVLCFTHSSLCHTYSPGNCPSVEPIHDFDMTKFLGRWYAIQKTTTKSSCLIYNFTEGKKSGEYFLEQTSEGYPTKLNVSYVFDYTGKIKAHKNSSTMSIHFPLSVAGSASFDVVTTDYETYAGIYTCQNLLFFKRQSATFLSRTNTIDENVLMKMRSVFHEENLTDLHLNHIRHDNCNEANSQILLTVKSNLASSINFSQIVSTLPSVTDLIDSEKQSNRRIDDEVEVLVTIEPAVEAAVKPVVEPAVKPVVEPAVEPPVEPIDELAIEPIDELAIEPIDEVAVEPAVEYDFPDDEENFIQPRFLDSYHDGKLNEPFIK